MRKKFGVFLVVLAACCVIVTQAVSGTPSPRASAAADPTPHTITFDKYSLMIDGQRTFIWSGEFDAFRLPSPSLWRDILEKMKSNGYNAVTIYFDWGYHSAAPGVYDFSGIRNMDQLLDIANQTGIYVIARPGPYINGETDAGGFPDWLEETSGTDRSNNATYESFTDQWQHAIDPIIARHQLTNGTGSVILYQIENEYASNLNTTTGLPYMQHLYNTARADGITVPIFHNDKGRNGDWVPGSTLDPGAAAGDHDYLYGFDGYPGGMCSSSGSPGTPSAPPDWGYYGTGGATGGATASPNTPGFWAESGTGWFDNWGGVGYSCLNTRMGPAYERTESLTAEANGLKIISPYMTFGGTNWGWLPADVVYTSYDYGAPINEARQQTTKVSAMKELGYFVQSVTPIDQVDKASTVAATNITPTGAAVKVYHDTNPTTGTAFYIVRNDSSSNNTMFNLPISTADGTFTIPTTGKIQLNGIDAKIITANYNIDSQHLVYSTADIMTHGTINGQDVELFDNRTGQTAETVFHFASAPTVNVLQGSATSSWDPVAGNLTLDYTTTGLVQVQVTGGGTNPLLLNFADDATAYTFWRLDTPQGMVLVRGPQLLRTAAVNGSEVDLTGDTTTASPLEVWAPGATTVTWNGNAVNTTTTPAGSLLDSDQLAAPPTITLPTLGNWMYHGEDPESQPSFDDSSWTVVNHTTSNSSTSIPSGQKVLFADDYGFHHGDIWYRGTYTNAAAATAVSIAYQAGGVGMVEAWLDGTYLGANQLPTPAVYSTSPTETATASFTIPAALRTSGNHELSVVVRIMGHSEDGGANNANKAARGLTAVTLTGSTSTQIGWKIQGNQGGENLTDTVRGPFNNGGLYGERAGWYLAGYPDSNWTPVTLPYSDPNPGVAWYRSTFSLNEPSGVDASLGLNITDPATKVYRATIFLNGWNMGQYINNVGPQHTFVLPNGVLNPNGSNQLAIAVITNNAGGGTTGGGLGTVSLVNLGTAEGGAPLTMNNSPAYVAPTMTGVPASAGSGGYTVSGNVASVSEPADALGTSLSATIDWGDGNQTSGTVTGSAGSYNVSGSHAYGGAGHYPVTVTLNDQYGSAVLATASTSASVGPTTTASLSPAPVNGYYNQNPTVTLTANAGSGTATVASTMYQVDGGGFKAYTTPFVITGEGMHTLQFYSTDSQGDTEPTNTQIVQVDTTPPTTSASLAPSPVGGYYNQNPMVTLTATDAVSGVAQTQYQIDGGGFQTYTVPFTVSGDGSHTIGFRSTDTAGNVEATKTQTFKVDTTAPTTSATFSPAAVNGYYNQNPTVTLSATDGSGSGVAQTQYQVDGGSVQTYSGPFVVVGDGPHTIGFSSTDTAGNIEAPKSVTITVDTTPPTSSASVSPTPTGGAVNGPATVTLSATDAISGVANTHYSIDGGATQLYGGPFTITAGGAHMVSYYSTDVAGNNETTRTLAIQVNPQATTGLVGTVPSTLAVSVGSTAPSLGAFTAGVGATYTATVGATITTTAQSSTFTASDTSTVFPGHLVNNATGGPYALPQGLQVAASDPAGTAGSGIYSNLATTNPATLLSYPGPVSNDPVTVSFQQQIASTDPLRTGTYSKAITLTLSTGTP